MVTITHPHHPLHGQKVAIVRIRQGTDPDLVVRLADGTHAAIAMSGTDYATPPDCDRLPDPLPLLDPQGLRQVARLVEEIGKRQHTTEGMA